MFSGLAYKPCRPWGPRPFLQCFIPPSLDPQLPLEEPVPFWDSCSFSPHCIKKWFQLPGPVLGDTWHWLGQLHSLSWESETGSLRFQPVSARCRITKTTWIQAGVASCVPKQRTCREQEDWHRDMSWEKLRQDHLYSAREQRAASAPVLVPGFWEQVPNPSHALSPPLATKRCSGEALCGNTLLGRMASS